jgi:hypothetical protein
MPPHSAEGDPMTEEQHFSHGDLPDAGSTPHHIIDATLPTDASKLPYPYQARATVSRPRWKPWG